MLTTMIDYIRIALYTTLIVIIFILFQTWQKDHPKIAISNPTAETHPAAANNYVPEISNINKATAAASRSAAAPATNSTAASTHLIHVLTNTLEVDIDAVGGNIVQVRLLKYPQELHSSTPFLLL